MNSKNKGGRGEREFAALCRAEGYDNVKRGQQFAGGVDSPDVKGLDGIHIEVKRTERLNLQDAMSQSIRDSNGQALPIVASRKNHCEWLITMRAVDWFKLYREYDAGEFINEQRDI